jgi:branched-chain amino acid transport system substrate-binding protein
VAVLCFTANAHGQISDNVVRIGILNDMSGPYKDLAGPGSVLAAQMAAEDFRRQSARCFH